MLNRPLLAADRLVPLSEVLHHAGNGLTPARLAAQMLSEILDILGALEPSDNLLRLAHRHALEIIDAIDATISRLDSLGANPDPRSPNPEQEDRHEN